MTDDQDVEETEATSYEANTVEELRDELRARDLHTSGHKEELIARLEEDDAMGAAGTSRDLVATDQDDLPNPDPAKRIYSPYELPANTAAAQAFVNANPDAVDPSLGLDPPERQEAAQANIYDHVAQMEGQGVTVEDPRLEGYTPPPEPELPVAPPPEAAEQTEEATV